jgi:hypothetical protein
MLIGVALGCCRAWGLGETTINPLFVIVEKNIVTFGIASIKFMLITPISPSLGTLQKISLHLPKVAGAELTTPRFYPKEAL